MSMTRMAEDNMRSMAGIFLGQLQWATAQISNGVFALFFAVRGLHCMKPILKVKNCFHFVSSFGLNQKNQKRSGQNKCSAVLAGPTHIKTPKCCTFLFYSQ